MLRTPLRYTLLYDSNCPICLRSVQRLKRWDRRKELIFLPAGDPSVREQFPSLSREALEASIHLVGPEGRIWEGADAVERLFAILPGFSRARWVFRIPLVRPLARRVYRWIARNRYQLTCGRHCRD